MNDTELKIIRTKLRLIATASTLPENNAFELERVIGSMQRQLSELRALCVKLDALYNIPAKYTEDAIPF